MLDHFSIVIDKKDDLTQSKYAKQPLTTNLRRDIIWSAKETSTVACFLRFFPVYFGLNDMCGDARDTEVKD